mmetsp:Transcript_11720/g.17796  ORF Transcript_11720/g.17796 Transcript_11720/m.17796 type:complete len:395 (-) Transcript_11720:1349-2533(-)
MSFNHSNSNNGQMSEEKKPEYWAARIAPCNADGFRLQRTSYFNNSKSSPDTSINRQGMAMTNSRQSPTCRWSVTKPCPVPLFGLDNKAVLVHDSAPIVSSRIDQSLRLRSVQAQFDNVLGEASCETSSSVQYIIGLFAGPEGSTYVEVRKMRGCVLAFRGERDAVINAARGLGGKQTERPSAPKLSIPKELMSLYVPPSMSELEDTLERASDQFHSRNRHTMLFALQNLVSMTNANKVYTETAHNMSKLIMQNKSDIRDMLVTIYISEAHNVRDNLSMQICNAVLQILINGIFALSNSVKNDGFLDGECKYFVEQLVPCLVESVGKCHFAHNTCLALNCLCLLTKKSSIACAKAREMDAGNIIQQAELYGKREHLELEEAARSMLFALDFNRYL